MFDKLFDFVVSATKREVLEKYEKDNEQGTAARPLVPCQFRVDRKAAELIDVCTRNALHHREREKHYTTKLEEAEKKLKEEGISMEVFDAATGTFMNVNSGSIGSGSFGAGTQQFQPRVDQKLLDACKNAKNKMIEHREKAEKFEKYATAFAMGPEVVLRLGVDDIHYFRLGKE